MQKTWKLWKRYAELVKTRKQHQECIQTAHVVAINAFPTDTKAELDLVEEKCKELGVNVALSEVWAKGGEGGLKLAEEVIRLVEEPNDFTYAYELEGSIEDKLNQIVQKAIVKTCRSDSKCSETGKTVRGSWLRQLPDLCG